MGRFSTALGAVTAAALAGAMILCVHADTYDISQGDLQIIADGGKQTVIYGTLAREDAAPVVTGKGGSVRLKAEKDAVLHVTFQNTEADFSDREDLAPVTVEGEGRILLELDGINSFTAGPMHAGVETASAAVYITDDREPAGILNVQGGRFAAGIGGAAQCDGGNVFILGGSVNARGGTFGAGIGGGQNGSGRQIAVLGGQVSISGGVNAAGIGGGWCGGAENICITGGSVTVSGGPAAQELTISPESENLSVGDGFTAVQVIKAGDMIALDTVDTVAVIEPAEETVQEMQTEEVQAEEVQTEETQTEETQAEETQTEETQTEETQTEETQAEETQTEEAQPEEVQTKEAQAEKVQTEEAQPEEVQTKEVQAEKAQTEEAQTEETQAETVQPEKPTAEKEETAPETNEAEPENAVSETKAVEEPAEKAESEEPTEPEAPDASKETEVVNEETANEAESSAASDEVSAIAMQTRDGDQVEFTSSVEKKLWTLHTDCPAPVVSVSRSYLETLQENGVLMLRIYCGNKTITTNLNAILSRASQEETVVIGVAGGSLHLVKDGNTINIPTLK